ncbi:MAG: hypothetical protein EZS28_018106 [Streblomastix strix]|uniref:Protein kinase domain-containing protein n=1 Tax=Streblomastix strix TaxID=222440 RepID=A0A5J4VUQ2_9EUKA|nr:MAG: hypothetical protein EZS28_018106 [Streblomastix strix]
MEFANYNTLKIISRQNQVSLPACAIRVLMKQILEGLRVFHMTCLIHRDIKCDNILLHCPPGSGKILSKISDFGMAKKEDNTSQKLYVKGTPPYMSPEIFKFPLIITQKVDIYAAGITFIHLLTGKYQILFKKFEEYKQFFDRPLTDINPIERPKEITNNALWNLLSKLVEFNPEQRFTAEQALSHEFFTGPEAQADISHEQQELAKKSVTAEQNGDQSITQYDKDPSFILPESIIKEYINNKILNLQTNSSQSSSYQRVLNYWIMEDLK